MNTETGRTEIRVWKVDENRLRLVDETSFASERLEKNLEQWLERNPDLLGAKLLVIGRQVTTTSGPLDLLAIDATGALHIIELKRAMLPREAVTQALDYASWLDSTSTEEIIRVAEDYLEAPLDETFQDKFGDAMPDITPQNHKILVVGTGLDAGAERLIGYLSQRHSLQINAVFFRYVKVAGEELLIRSLLVPEALAERSSRRSVRGPSELLEMARNRGAEDWVEILRTLSSASGQLEMGKEYVSEQPAPTYGGSFRYWRNDLGGKGRMVFGVSLGGHWGAKGPEVDVWVRPREIAQVTGVSGKRVRDIFAAFKNVQTNENLLVIRLGSEKEARRLVRALKKLFDDHPGFYKTEK
jgi:hypothetical protein